MSGLYENPLFPRGATYANGISSLLNTNDSMLGKEYIVQDGDTANGTGQNVRIRIVRNKSGITLEAKRTVRFATNATYGPYGTVVDGYTATSAERGYPVDQLLTGGCPDGDMCYIVVSGPALCKTDLAGGANNVISVGDLLYALTAATSGATTSGRVYTGVFTGATAVLEGQILGVIGAAMSAKTTAQSNGDVLVSVGSTRW